MALEHVPATAQADHPLVGSFLAAFESDDAGIHRESISGLTNPHWWKQKVSRWRGAATDAEPIGDHEVWLCAGGLRADGDSKDFYAAFMEGIKHGGPERYLPTDADRLVQKVEAKVARREAWLQQVKLSAMVALHQTNKSGLPQTIHVPAPAPAEVSVPLLHMTFEFDRIASDEDELVELMLVVQIADHTRPMLATAALDAVRSVVEPVAEAWRVLPGKGSDQIWSALVPPEVLQHAGAAHDDGLLPEHVTATELTLGVRAHYTHKDGIVGAAIEGDAVRGLCGQWFVPTSAPDDLPVCPTCKVMYEGMPRP
jgi:hypothetical protein